MRALQNMGTPCVSRTIPVGSSNNNGGIASDMDYLYVINQSSVYKIHKKFGTIEASVSVGDTLFLDSISVDDMYVWITAASANRIFVINKDTGCFNTAHEIVGFFSAPYAIHSNGTHSEITYVWIANKGNDTVNVFTVTNGLAPCILPVLNLNTTISLPEGSGPACVFADLFDNVWIAGSNNSTLYQYNLAGALVASYGVGKQPGGIYSDGTHVWVTHKDETFVTRYTINSTLSRTDIDIGAPTYDITYDYNSGLWVSNYGASSGKVYRIYTDENTVSATTTVDPTHPSYGVTSDSTNVWCVLGNNQVAELLIPGGCGSGGDPYVTTISNVRYKLPALNASIRFYQGVVDGKLLTINAQLRTTPNADMTADNLRSYFEYKHKVPAHKRKELEYAVYAKEDLCFYEKFYISYNDSELVVNVWEPKFKFESYKGKVVSETSTRTDLIARCTGAYDNYETNTLKFTFGSANLYISVYPNRLVRSSVYLEAPNIRSGNGVVVNTLSVKHMTLGALNSRDAVPKKDSVMKEKEEWFLDHAEYRTRKFYMSH